ncbi:MAG TPA: hypothetical protein VKW77_01105 [Acidimicrobiales bacterium]|nr:hypothetical protein [Acidimicrobiales bacterium]
MLYLHETHRVMGRHAADFEALYREEWMPRLAASDGARLLWYLDHAMGSGPSYQVVTVIALAGGEAWEELAGRVLAGDLRDLDRRTDACRYESEGKMLLPVAWSELQEVDLGEVPSDGREHEPTLYMQDTGWPDAPLEDYVNLWNDDYWAIMRRVPAEHRLLDVVACFEVAHGTGVRPEAMLMQKIVNLELLGRLLTETREYDPSTWPGSYMAKGLELRDQWESKLLRTSRWSPIW